MAENISWRSTRRGRHRSSSPKVSAKASTKASMKSSYIGFNNTNKNVYWRERSESPLPNSISYGVPVMSVDDAYQAVSMIGEHGVSKHALKKADKKRIARAIMADTNRWTHGVPTIYRREDIHHGRHTNFVNNIEEALADFFEAGFTKYFNDGIPAARSKVIAFIQEIVKKYGLRISGGFILKNIGVYDEDQIDFDPSMYVSFADMPMPDKERGKPSIDVDIYVPFNTPDIYPEFYDVMAQLFNCDKGARAKWSIRKTITSILKGPNKVFFEKNNIASVFKHQRASGTSNAAEMDLVRANISTTPEMIIKSFDLSVCMNWYDGENVYMMDPPAVLKERDADGRLIPGHLSFSYVALLSHNVTRARIVKYITRGYRFMYVSPKTGEYVELTVEDLRDAFDTFAAPVRREYLKRHPSLERTESNMLVMQRSRSVSPIAVNRSMSPIHRSISPRSPIHRSMSPLPSHWWASPRSLSPPSLSAPSLSAPSLSAPSRHRRSSAKVPRANAAYPFTVRSRSSSPIRALSPIRSASPPSKAVKRRSRRRFRKD
jgi:hypothetical protein